MYRVLMSFWTGHSKNELLFFVFVAVGIIAFIIAQIIKLLVSRENKGSKSIIGRRSPNAQNNNFAPNYFDSSKHSNNPKSAFKGYGYQGGISNVDYNKEKTSQENEEPSSIPNNDYSDYVKREKEKGLYVRVSANEDGTPKTEIEFDIPAEEPTPVPFAPKYEYLTTANGGKFLKLLPTDEKSFFRTWVENGVRKFEFHGNKDKALANFNAVFDDVCEIVEGKQNGATQINNEEPGVLDSNLKVKTPAKIKLA